MREHPLEWIWNESDAFTRFRGTDWMQEPCRTCPLGRQEVDFGGCRCQALRLTGDAAATDPVCRFSPHHDRVVTTRESAGTDEFVAHAALAGGRPPTPSSRRPFRDYLRWLAEHHHDRVVTTRESAGTDEFVPRSITRPVRA